MTQLIEKLLKNYPAALVLGGVILFLAAASRGIPQLSLQIQEPGWRLAVAAFGIALTLCGIAVGLRTRRETKHLMDRSGLVESQRELLAYLESESRRRGSVRQEQIEDRFGGKYPGVYWRLETLSLLGFIEKEIADHKGTFPVYNYRLSDNYKKQLLGQEGREQRKNDTVDEP